jgi:GH24 family phage-related lysozyme (muramidase)
VPCVCCDLNRSHLCGLLRRVSVSCSPRAACAEIDATGLRVIGYGTLCSSGQLSCEGPVSKQQAARVLYEDLSARYVPCVRDAVKAPLNNNEFGALVSLAYNAGCGAAIDVIRKAGLDKETGAKYEAVPGLLAKYVKARIGSARRRVVVPGLVKRRAAEASLWRSAKPTACLPQSAANRVVDLSHSRLLKPKGHGFRGSKRMRDVFNKWWALKRDRLLSKLRAARNRPRWPSVQQMHNLKRGTVDYPSGTLV